MTETTPLLAPKPLYLQVAELVRQRIYQRELQSGDWIDEMKLAEEFGISRTPLREALKVLAAEGLVTMKPRRGAYVTETSEKDMRDVYQSLCAAVDDANRFFQINEAFHLQLLTLCDNRFLLQTVTDLRKVMKLNRHQSLFKQGRTQDSLQEHEALMQQLLARNAQGSRQAMLTHFSNGLQAAKMS